MDKEKKVFKVLNGELPSSTPGVQPKVRGGSYPSARIPEDVRKEIDPDWGVQILLEEHPEYDGKVFVIKMTSKWGPTEPIFFLPSDLYDSKGQKKIIKELVNKGRFIPDEIQALVEYVDCLKVTGPGVITIDDGSYKQYILETSDSVEGEIVDKVYKLIVDYVVDNISVFPTRKSNGFRKEDCHGAFLDDTVSMRKYGGLTVAIIETRMQEIVGIRNTKKLNAVLKELANRGVFHPGESESRKKVTLAERIVVNVYIFSIDQSLLPKEVIKGV
ncbi:hypothetical protein J41TS12_05830 [Paenibacillus antibioticophila]|uniref:Cch helix turn helix domain-containing protein n=1 Tax=Paenibacillus antibioticophila TaxID=1274374 RepID=A0A919XS70_9BACL|nr:hypothetical protein [Paenibacillus antibioticophila]GIO35722.1 hypothetical protein J41TS12_05830 [Paenibacillus antibioticophila]